MRKNILIFGHSYATQFIDINNQYTRLFDKNKYEVTVMYLVGSPDEKIKQQHLAEHVVFLNCSRKSIRGAKLIPTLKLLKICRHQYFEIIICHRYKPSYIMMWVAQFCKIGALFAVMHDLNTLKSRFRRLLLTLLRRRNMMFAGVSNAVRDDMRKTATQLPHERIITLYNALDVELTEPYFLTREVARKQFNIAPHTFLFGNVARLVEVKDQTSLLYALKQIKLTCPEAKVILMGNGELELQLKQLTTSLGLTNDVIFTGFVPQSFQYLKMLDAFILCSTREAFGRVLIEAMAAKIPLIGTRIGGIPEVIGDAGLLIDAKQPLQLAEAMRNIYQLSHPQRAEKGQQGYQRMLSHFSLPVFEESFWQAYAEVRGSR